MFLDSLFVLLIIFTALYHLRMKKQIMRHDNCSQYTHNNEHTSLRNTWCHPRTCSQSPVDVYQKQFVKKERPITDTKAMIPRSIRLYELVKSNISTNTVVSTAPAIIGISNNISSAMAPPNISASEVEMLASTALPVWGVLSTSAYIYWLPHSNTIR